MKLFAVSSLLVLGLLSAAQGMSETADQELLTADNGAPINYLVDGAYRADRQTIGNFRLNSWADEYNMTGTLYYGNYGVDFTINLTNNSGNTFEGRGEMQAVYGNKKICYYPVSMTIKAYERGLFVRYVAPAQLAETIYNDFCPAQPLQQFTEPSPYVRY
jgi:hypothetical protein